MSNGMNQSVLECIEGCREQQSKRGKGFVHEIVRIFKIFNLLNEGKGIN